MKFLLFDVVAIFHPSIDGYSFESDGAITPSRTFKQRRQEQDATWMYSFEPLVVISYVEVLPDV